MGKHFVLTISREFGAEGHEIGKVLSERLGVKLIPLDNYKTTKPVSPCG